MKKKCSSCQKEIQITFFNKNKAQKDGLYNICRTCRIPYNNNRNWFKKWRITNPDMYKASQRRGQKAYRARYPEKEKAHLIARKNKAKLLKDTCEKCGELRGELHMHHSDYSKPLQVITLCEPCHYGEHHI